MAQEASGVSFLNQNKIIMNGGRRHHIAAKKKKINKNIKMTREKLQSIVTLRFPYKTIIRPIKIIGWGRDSCVMEDVMDMTRILPLRIGISLIQSREISVWSTSIERWPLDNVACSCRSKFLDYLSVSRTPLVNGYLMLVPEETLCRGFTCTDLNTPTDGFMPNVALHYT